ncbi:uncharacterized protein [Rutidosis leptorrhynchoides]|uniref:uncharacterized protein n=1 Tax=Rutidosis leptorrhynchoides TaxID=125765 RepID=UPI003A998DA1
MAVIERDGGSNKFEEDLKAVEMMDKKGKILAAKLCSQQAAYVCKVFIEMLGMLVIDSIWKLVPIDSTFSLKDNNDYLECGETIQKMFMDSNVVSYSVSEYNGFFKEFADQGMPWVPGSRIGVSSSNVISYNFHSRSGKGVRIDIIDGFIKRPDERNETTRGTTGVLQHMQHRQPPRAKKFRRVQNFEYERKIGMPRKKHDKVGPTNNEKTYKGNRIIPDSHAPECDKQPPLVSTLKATAEQNVARFHFPGHNMGRAAPSSLTRLIGVQPFLHDFTPLPELDNLFAPKGPILNAQKEAARLFGAKETWFLVGGTTCGIQASVMATCSPGDTLILPRNCHISAFNSMVFSGVTPKYIIPDYDFDWDIPFGITPSQVEIAIKELAREGRKASAVFVTCPTYHGICTDLERIALLCHYHDIPLIVDEAHGAHLGFHQNLPPSALSQGADLVVQSTHKVLCSLSQSSMLHMSGKIVNRERVSQCLQSLQSTSPSYLLLASLDAARAQISENQETIFNKPVEIAMEAKSLIEKIDKITVLKSDDPLRITVGVYKLGISGYEADDILYDYGVVSELTGTSSVTFAVNLGTNRHDVLWLVSSLQHLSQLHNSTRLCKKIKNVCMQSYKINTKDSMRLSPREAFFASKTKVSYQESIGKVCGELICPYPPGIPLLIPGEVITAEALGYLVELKKNGGSISGAADPSLSFITICD